MKSLLTAATLLLGLITGPSASAGPILYSTTDLGAGSQVEKDASGHIFGLANASGSMIYAFDKAPVIHINEAAPSIDPRYSGGFTLQSGSYKVGYYSGDPTGAGQIFLNWPTIVSARFDWATRSSDPVTDINIQGQAVGLSLNGTAPDAKTYAAFSEPGLQIHFIPNPPLKDNPTGFAGGRFDDNLNDYIAPIRGVSLVSTSLIDDGGRIVARGDNGHDYLLTPTTVPEPPTWMMLALASGPLAARSTCRRREGR